MREVKVTTSLVADLLVVGERLPVNVHVIEHEQARILVDTGIRALHPAIADMEVRLFPFDIDPDSIDIVVNTHLHFDHCGNNHLFAGKPVYVQRRELEDARSKPDYTIAEWRDPPHLSYTVVDGEHQLLPGIRLVPAPGHTDGLQVVVIETAGKPIVIGGDVAVWLRELDKPVTEGQHRVRALNPGIVWITHANEPWRCIG